MIAFCVLQAKITDSSNKCDIRKSVGFLAVVTIENSNFGHQIWIRVRICHVANAVTNVTEEFGSDGEIDEVDLPLSTRLKGLVDPPLALSARKGIVSVGPEAGSIRQDDSEAQVDVTGKTACKELLNCG